MKKQLKTKPAKEKKKTGIELETVLFKDMVARARKGASNNNIIPLTSMMAIELKNNKLTLTTTDSKNYLYIIQDGIPGDDFYCVVIADTFAQLVSKTTSETIQLTFKNNYLEFVGNGKYSIELPDDEGEMIEFPDPREDAELETLEDIHLSTIRTILNTVKPSLSVTMEELCYTGYYCGEQVVATDGYKMCNLDVQLWEEPKLIPPQLMDLLSVMTSEEIGVEANEDTVVFSSPDCVVYGRTMDCIEDFAIDDIQDAINTEYSSMCTVKKSSLLQVLDRISLFVTKNDKDEANFTFTDRGLQINSKGLSGTEVIKYLESEEFEDFTCIVDIKEFTNEVKALTGDEVEIWYGSDSGIKLTEGNVTIVVALSGEFEEDEEDNEDEE